MKAKRYPCPKEDCDGVLRETATVGNETKWDCTVCGERFVKNE